MTLELIAVVIFVVITCIIDQSLTRIAKALEKLVEREGDKQ